MVRLKEYRRGHDFTEFYNLLNKFKAISRQDEGLRFLVNLAEGYVSLSESHVFLIREVDQLKKKPLFLANEELKLKIVEALHKRALSLRRAFNKKYSDPKIRKAFYDDFYKPLTNFYKEVIK